jgi:AraC family transcriptional regulator
VHAVHKALWFVEANSRKSYALEHVAGACAVSPFHLTRAFAAVTGLSLMRYVRARRLSEAAHQLAAGANDILGLALDMGYGSHEAFTRAFREHFGVTPEQVRAQGQCSELKLTEPIYMSTTSTKTLEDPRIVTSRPMILAGLSEHYDCQDPSGIPALWQRFGAHLGHIPNEVRDVAYGACYNFDSEGFYDYMACVEVTAVRDLPSGFKTLNVPAEQYAVFKHREHVAGIRETFAAIWSSWLPNSQYKAIEGVTLERYGPEFDPRTGMGGLEIWVPVA